MTRNKNPIWLEEIKQEIIDVLALRINKDLGGPLSVLRYGKGNNFERLGTIFKLIGENEKAKKAFTEASLAYWPYDCRKPARGWQEGGLEYSNDRDCGYRQVKAAICAFLSGDKERADLLFTWARLNIEVPKYALDYNRPGGEGEHPISGQVLLRQAYVEARLSQFEGITEKIKEAKDIFAYFDKKDNKRTDMEYRYQCEILKELAVYKLNPTQENKAKAQDALAAYRKACHENIQGLMNYFYIFDLQEAFPEVFEPVLP